MKEVPQTNLPEISGGDHDPDGCIPYPGLDNATYPRNPFGPIYEAPTGPQSE